MHCIPDDVTSEQKSQLREFREWGTFGLSLVTLIAIPVGLVILHNQRLEIEKDVSQGFISKASYNDDRNRAEQDRRDTLQSISELKGKVDVLITEQVRLADTLAVLKESSRQKLP